ncbi:MAG: Crp/Fnr family transcriptional regulator [Desulfovibrionaceae bacterium]|nr:Crp/Fnr family transcriptional regulator [Desulfovibrionaceae bacterium]
MTPPASTLHQRRRPLEPAELAGVPWLPRLTVAEQDRAIPELRISEAAPGEIICRIGRPATYWFGLVDGLLKMSTDTARGQTITYSGLAPGGWFGEGTALKREAYRYNVQALRKSLVAGLPLDTFHWLLEQSIGFNRFVMSQFNERLAQFIITIEADRTPNPEQRVARNLAALANPVLFPGVGELLRITQQELAYLAGLSRQRVNEALKTLAAQGLIQIQYGGLRILDLAALRGRFF